MFTYKYWTMITISPFEILSAKLIMPYTNALWAIFSPMRSVTSAKHVTAMKELADPMQKENASECSLQKNVHFHDLHGEMYKLFPFHNLEGKFFLLTH